MRPGFGVEASRAQEAQTEQARSKAAADLKTIGPEV